MTDGSLTNGEKTKEVGQSIPRQNRIEGWNQERHE